MPNCDFYANIEDHKIILNKLFEENECEIYELSSKPEKSLKQFYKTEQVLNEFNQYHSNGKKWSSVNLQLYVLGSSPEFIPRKVMLNPEKCNGFKYRYNADNFGLVQLYLEAPNENVLSNSHTNHNTKKRAEKWATTKEEIHEVALCDFEKITKFSSKLNRMIRILSIGKLTSRPVLPGALKHWNDGMNFGPYSPEKFTIDFKKV